MIEKLNHFSFWLDQKLDAVIWKFFLLWNAIGGAYMFWVLLEKLAP